jgi:uncharacterized protein (DUF2236 family)
VLLQVAHPLVAVGVAEHSDYHRDLWSRLGRTLRALYLIAFGTKAEAEAAGAAVQACTPTSTAGRARGSVASRREQPTRPTIPS